MKHNTTIHKILFDIRHTFKTLRLSFDDQDIFCRSIKTVSVMQLNSPLSRRGQSFNTHFKTAMSILLRTIVIIRNLFFELIS